MNWTKEIPAVDGWYWIREQGEEYCWIDVVENSSRWCEVFEEYVEIQPEYLLEFCGPIEQPK